MHSNSGTPRRYSESDKRRSVSMKRPMPLKPGLKAVSSTPLTAAALAKVPTVSAMSATSAFCFSARPDLMDPIPTVEAEKTANRIPVGTKKKDLFNKGEPKQKLECPDVQPVSKSIKEPTRKGINELANQLDDARNDAEQLENNSKTGSKLAAGRCMSMITEEFFLQEFENVNSDHILPDFELREAVGTIIEVLNNTSTVWTRQVANLKQLRSLMKTGDKPRCSDILPSLLGPLQTSVRSLRSQVVREACITVGYLSTLFGVEFGYTAEHLLPSLIASLHKSVKVISQSSHICIRIVIKNTQFADMIPVVASNLSSKSKFIRRGSMEILCQMLCMWPQDMLDKQTAVLRSTINLGINDADSDTRIEARRTFNVFESRFPTCADALFKSLNAVKQKVIHPSVSPTAYSKLVDSASVSIASCASSSVDIAETVTLANPTVLSTTHNMSPPDFCDNTHVEIMSTSPPQNKQGGHSDPAMAPDVAPMTPERNGDVNDDELLRTLDILQKSVLGSAHGDISQLPVQTTVKHSGTATVLSASRSVNKRRDDVKKDVLSKLAEIEHMVMCDATKPGGAIPSYKEPVPKNESPQPSPDLATTRDNKVAGRCSFDSECGMIELTTSTSEGATTGEETPLVTPITIFKSKLKAKELPSTSTK
ncbi:hypothetical protein LSAT2_023722 [Lamellibrachia satsuma]|nr:hypothetical protein LSAT2_023722 [Lamellibrachia satsuma]